LKRDWCGVKSFNSVRLQQLPAIPVQSAFRLEREQGTPPAQWAKATIDRGKALSYEYSHIGS
jgi:hypothetical protein